MTDHSERDQWPVGIDLGSMTTIGATVSEGEPQLLHIDNKLEIPTRLGVGGDGFVIGEEANSSEDDTLLPLPYLGDSQRSTTTFPGDVPLTLFFQLLLKRWEKNLDQSPRDSSGCSDPADNVNDEVSGSSDLGSEADEIADETGHRRTDSSTIDPFDPPENKTVSQENESDDHLSNEPSSTGKNEASSPAFESGDVGPKFAPTTIAVPGGYSTTDITDVEEAAEAAGFTDVNAVRNPVAAVATAAKDMDEIGTIAAVDIGSVWESYAIVTVDEPGQLNVEARTVRSDGGRVNIDQTVAQWVLGQVESEHGVTLQCTDETMKRIRQACHEALNAIDPNGETTGTVDLTLREGVDVTDGGLLVSDGISIDIELDLATIYRQVLKEEREEIQSTIGTLLDSTAVDNIDELVLTGDGTIPGPVSLAIEKAFDRRPDPLKIGDQYTASALGASLLSARRATGEEAVGRETLNEDIEIRALGTSGVEDRCISDPAHSHRDLITSKLSFSSPEQVEGTFEIIHRHRITDNVESTSKFRCSNLSEENCPKIALSITPDPSAPDNIVVEIDGTTSDGTIELKIERIDEISTPWLAHSDVDCTELQDLKSESVHRYEHHTDTEQAFIELDKEGVARAVWEIRKKLWSYSINKDQDLSVDQLEMLLREFDKNLERHDIEVIEPEVGEKLDASRHSVTRATESDSEPETILEVLSLGFAVNGKIIEPARVEAAK